MNISDIDLLLFMLIMMLPIILLCLSYLCGSILFGNVVAKVFKIGNLATQGSGNVGATNLVRVSGNKKLGIIVAVLDGLKGIIPVLIAKTSKTIIILVTDDLSNLYFYSIGAMAVLGHIFPVWKGYKGGKGIATFIGVNLALNFQVGCILSGIWIITFVWKRISSLASICMVVASIFIYMLFYCCYSLPIMIISLLILFKHKDNMRRIMNGSEQSFKK